MSKLELKSARRIYTILCKLIRAVFPYVINQERAGAVLVMALMCNMGIPTETRSLERKSGKINL